MLHPLSQMALEIHMPSNESSLLNDSDYNFHASTSMAISSQKPGQKRTRQWAAWTRQEQENFFSALRQVGKNFEKITCRVQSKNKNQVRYYYYRLVRRMNKLLSPGFCLDAKNSKDTNSAMLRWWSLVEKYSCTPSKLHRKPRRFKIFIEALENQLLKDRNKARRKRQCQGENCLETSSAFLRRFSEQDFVGVKAVLAESENTAKLGINRASSVKRNSNSNTFSKEVFSAMKASGHRHRAGMVESAAYKRWEKAAMAGVSLVAEAAEQLERVANARNYSNGIGEPAREKLKLQLFPIDEDTRQRLEKGEHNPFLELTLSARKRMSSVVEHLNRKWGANTIDSGKLLLLPYNAQQDQMAKCHRWTIKDADSTAADVFVALGKPSVFRLRYGWFSGDELRARFSSSPLEISSNILSNAEDNAKRFMISYTSDAIPPICCEPTLIAAETMATAQTGTLKLKEHFPETSDKSALIAKKATECSLNQQEDMADPAVKSSSELLAGEWADSLTDISVGDLLLEASDVSSQQNALSIQLASYSCDSFDAAVAAHNYFPQFTQTQPSAVSSIWNADETCDGFSFHSSLIIREKSSNPSLPQVCKEMLNAKNSSGSIDRFIEESRPSDDDPCDLPESEKLPVFSYKPEPTKDASSFTDLYWPDSLGSLGHLDLNIPFSKYQGQELCFNESTSQSSFTRTITGCLDAFQNGSLLLETTVKKEISGAAIEPSPFNDDKT